MKKCYCCDKNKPLDDFHNDFTSRRKLNKQSQCKECMNARLRKRYAKDVEYRKRKLKAALQRKKDLREMTTT